MCSVKGTGALSRANVVFGASPRGSTMERLLVVEDPKLVPNLVDYTATLRKLTTLIESDDSDYPAGWRFRMKKMVWKFDLEGHNTLDEYRNHREVEHQSKGMMCANFCVVFASTTSKARMMCCVCSELRPKCLPSRWCF